MRISYSSLENFQNCPLKYKFSEIDKIKEPKTKEQVFGNYIHEVLKWFYQQDPHFPTLDHLLEYYYNHWPSGVKTVLINSKKEELSIWQNEQEEKDYFQEGLRILENYYHDNFPPKSLIIELETRFEAVVDEKPNEPGGKHVLTGIIDRIDKLPDGTLEVIDYKTGKKLPTQNEVDKNLQLSIYALGLLKKWPKIDLNRVKLSLYFLKFNEKIETTKDLEDIKKTQNKIIDLIHQIQTSNFQPKPSVLCNWCGYRPICPVWRHLYEESGNDNINIEEKIDQYFELKKQKTELEQKLKELKSIIENYSKRKGLKRIYGNNGSFYQEEYQKIYYNKQQLKNILEPLGKWEEVLAIDPKKLEKILKEIPPELREEIEKAKKIEKQFEYLEEIEKGKDEWKEEFH